MDQRRLTASYPDCRTGGLGLRRDDVGQPPDGLLMSLNRTEFAQEWARVVEPHQLELIGVVSETS